MSILKQVKDEVSNLEAGKLFTYSNFDIPEEKFGTLAKSLSLLCKEGILRRISKGIYYKPEYFSFGNSLPTDSEIIEIVLKKNKSKIAYITGINAYNQLGLTTQVSKKIVVAIDNNKKKTKIQNTEIKFVKARVSQNIEKLLDIPILQILDAITDIKKIPDTNINTSCKILFQKIKKLDNLKIKRLSELVLYYPPVTRALVGAFLELLKEDILSKKIKSTLNKLTSFKLGVSEEILPNKKYWKIL